MTDRPTDRPSAPQANQCKISGSLWVHIVFGAKTKGRLRFVKHKQLKTSAKSTQKKKKFFVSVEHRAIPHFLISYWLCPLVWSTEIEKGRENEKVGRKQARSALVTIRRKALLSSVGFRKRMTSRLPRGSPCDSCKPRFDRPLWFVCWADVCFEVLSCFFDHPSIDSTKRMPLHLFGKDVLMFRLDQASKCNI